MASDHPFQFLDEPFTYEPEPSSDLEVDCWFCDSAGCHMCNGSGAVRVEAVPVTLEDLEEMTAFEATIEAIRAAIELFAIILFIADVGLIAGLLTGVV